MSGAPPPNTLPCWLPLGSVEPVATGEGRFGISPSPRGTPPMSGVPNPGAAVGPGFISGASAPGGHNSCEWGMTYSNSVKVTGGSVMVQVAVSTGATSGSHLHTSLVWDGVGRPDRRCQYAQTSVRSLRLSSLAATYWSNCLDMVLSIGL